MTDEANGARGWVVKPLPRPRGELDYLYEIWRGRRLVATFRHDNRCESCLVELPDGTSEPWMLGSAASFLQGGADEPPRLSPAALEWLEARDWERQGCESCRASWERGAPPPQVASSARRGGTLHRCPRCGTWWERRAAGVEPMHVDEARRHYPVPIV